MQVKQELIDEVQQLFEKMEIAPGGHLTFRTIWFSFTFKHREWPDAYRAILAGVDQGKPLRGDCPVRRYFVDEAPRCW